MSFGPDFDVKERVRQATDIVDLVGRYVALRRQGRNLVGLCPFHDDRHPSMQINPERQSWKCWVCNLGGDCFSFVMQREGIDFREALQMLADGAGIQLDQSPGPNAAAVAGTAQDKPFLYRAMQWAAEQYHQCLTQDPIAAEARDYLESRSVEPPTADRFMLGFAPDQWSWLIDRARSTPYSPAVLEACGLVERKSEAARGYDRFRGRWMFPIRDTQQRVIAFGGRVLPAAEKDFIEKFGRSPAKYINSPETKLYTKSDHLYGLDIVRDAVIRERRIIIVEGYTDVVLTWQAGIDNIAAVLGTALNERHLRLIKRFADQVVLVLDGDEAGQKRTNEVLDLFVSADLDLRILTLPAGLDPCDYVQQQGLDTFQAAIKSAKDALDHKIDMEIADIDLVHETHRASTALENVLATVAKAPRMEIRTLATSGLREQAIVTKLARRFHAPEDALRQRLEELRKPLERRQKQPVPVQPSDPLAKAERHEIELLEVLLSAPDKIDEIMQNISPDQFVIGPVRDLYEAFCHCYHTGIELDFSTAMTAVDDPVLKSTLVAIGERAQDKLTSTAPDIDRWTADVVGVFNRLLETNERQRLINQMDNQNLSEEEEKDALARIFAQKLAEQQQRS